MFSGGLTALIFGLASTDAHGWLSARTLTALSLSAVLLAAFAIIDRRARPPLVAPHTWKVLTLLPGTTVMDQVRQHGDHADRWHSRATHLAVGHRGPLECPGRGLQSRRLADHRSGPGSCELDHADDCGVLSEPRSSPRPVTRQAREGSAKATAGG